MALAANIALCFSAFAETYNQDLPMYCPSCSTLSDYSAKADSHIWTNPDTSVPANQQYNANVWLFSDVPGEVVKIRYGTMMEMEGWSVYYTPFKQSTEIFALETVTVDETFLALQIAILGKNRRAVIIEDVVLDNPIYSFNTSVRGEDTMIELRTGVSAQVMSFLNANAVRGNPVSRAFKVFKGANDLSDAGVRLIFQIVSQDGSYAWVFFTGTTQSMEPIIYVDEDGEIVIVIEPELMDEIEEDEVVDNWLEENPEFDNLSSNVGDETPRGADVGAYNPSTIPRRFQQCDMVVNDGSANIQCKWIRLSI